MSTYFTLKVINLIHDLLIHLGAKFIFLNLLPRRGDEFGDFSPLVVLFNVFIFDDEVGVPLEFTESL